MSWNPWTALRARTDVELRWAELDGARGEVILRVDGRYVITIDPRLDQTQRNATLAHELVHIELGLIWHEDTPDWVVARGEARVEQVTCDRLVPPLVLGDFLRRRATVGSVLARDVAERFEVPVELADRSLRRFLQDDARRRSA